MSDPIASATDTSRTPAGRAPVSLVPVAFLLFLLSGLVALVYEVCWTRRLTLELGSSSLAVSTVLTVFMGGLALGAHLLGPLADRVTRPLLWYGIAETLVALYALATPLIFDGFLPLFTRLGTGLAENLWALSLLRFTLAGLLLLPPTFLMGATLPLLCRFYLLHRGDGGRGAGLLYGVNTIGAFLGTVLAGFLCLPQIGLARTILWVGAGNVALGLVAIALSRAWHRPARPVAPGTSAAPEPADLSGARLAIAFAIGLTGFAAMACEVVWTRVLILVLGPSIYAFTVVLSTFLIGLGIGSWLTALLLGPDPRSARRLFATLALLSAVLISVSSGVFPHLPPLFLKIFRAWDLASNADLLVAMQYLLAGSAMIVPTLVMGGLFPAAARAFLMRDDSAASGVGRLYAANTLGAILGSFAAGFLLVPLCGIRSTLLVASSLSGFAAFLALGGRGVAARLRAFAVAAAVVCALWWLSPQWDRHLMTSGVYQYYDYYSASRRADLRREVVAAEELLFYRDGLTSTVTVTRDLHGPRGDLFIYTNGKIDGSSHGDMQTQRLSAHLPLLLHPDPREICVIGIGTGCTAGSASLHPDTRVTLVEIEGEMVEGARLFAEHNHDVHHRDNVDIQVTDGRLYLNLHPSRHDVIISEPSNPWLAGATDLFTVEFYRLASRSLKPGGLFCQWLQLYGMSHSNLMTMIRSFRVVFPHVHIASTILESDILLIGSFQPVGFDLERLRRRFDVGAVRLDMNDPRVGVADPAALLARFLMGPEEVDTLLSSGPLHTDDLPVIAYTTPKDLYLSTRSENIEFLVAHAPGIAPRLEGADPLFLDRLRQAHEGLFHRPRSADGESEEQP